MGLNLGDALGGIADAVSFGTLGDPVRGLFGGGEVPTIPQATPMNVSGPYGSVAYDPTTRTLQLGQGTEQERAARAIRGDLLRGFDMSPLQQAYAQAAGGGAQQLFGLGNQIGGIAGQFPGYQQQLAGIQGSIAGLDPALAGMQGLFTGGGAGALGAGLGDLAQAGAIDPMAVAQSQYDKMQALMAPGRQEQRLATEARSLRQGLLGSTAGLNRSRGLEEAFGRADTAAAASALQQGQAARGTALQQALSQVGAGQGLLGAGAGLVGQRAGLFGAAGRAVGQQAGLAGTQAGLLGSVADLTKAGVGLQGIAPQIEDAARARLFQNISGIGALQSQALAPAGLSLGQMGAQQAAYNQQAQMQYQANQNQADALTGLLMGGLGAMTGNPAMAMGGLGSLFGSGGGGAAYQPQLFMQNPYGGMNTGVNIPNVNTGLNLGFNPTGGMY